MLPEDVFGHDLVRQVHPGAVVPPGQCGLAVEVVGLARELGQVLAAGDGPLAGDIEHGEVLGFERVDGVDVAAFGGFDVSGAPAPADEGVADMFAEERNVVCVVDLIADDGDVDVVVLGIADVLLVDADAAQRWFAHQEGVVEAGEHAGGEGLGPGDHVDHDEFVGRVHEVVKQQLDRADLRVVAGDAEVILHEAAGGGEADALVLGEECVEHRIRLPHREQARARAGRRGLEHELGGRDERVGPAQVVLDVTEVLTEDGSHGGGFGVEAERGRQVLVDVGVDRHDRVAERCGAPGEQRRHCGFATAAFADECEFHACFLSGSESNELLPSLNINE